MLLRIGSESEKALLNSPGWGLLNSAMQDLELIAKRLASKKFTENTLSKLKDNCDEQAFSALTGRIPFYAHFQKIADIVIQIKQTIGMDTDIVFARFNNVEKVTTAIEKGINGLRYCDLDSLADTTVYFAPTGLFQELSINNGWSDEYIKWANEFDILYNKIMNTVTPEMTHTSKDSPKTRSFLRRFWHKVANR